QQPVPPLPHLPLVRVEHRHNVESLPPETSVPEQRRTDLPRAHQRHPPPPPEPQNRSQPLQQVRHCVPQPPLPERAEKRQVLPHLRRRRASPPRRLLARHGAQPLLVQLGQNPEIQRQAGDGGIRNLLHRAATPSSRASL